MNAQAKKTIEDLKEFDENRSSKFKTAYYIQLGSIVLFVVTVVGYLFLAAIHIKIDSGILCLCILLSFAIFCIGGRIMQVQKEWLAFVRDGIKPEERKTTVDPLRAQALCTGCPKAGYCGHFGRWTSGCNDARKQK